MGRPCGPDGGHCRLHGTRAGGWSKRRGRRPCRHLLVWYHLARDVDRAPLVSSGLFPASGEDRRDRGAVGLVQQARAPRLASHLPQMPADIPRRAIFECGSFGGGPGPLSSRRTGSHSTAVVGATSDPLGKTPTGNRGFDNPQPCAAVRDGDRGRGRLSEYGHGVEGCRHASVLSSCDFR